MQRWFTLIRNIHLRCFTKIPNGCNLLSLIKFPLAGDCKFVAGSQHMWQVYRIFAGDLQQMCCLWMLSASLFIPGGCRGFTQECKPARIEQIRINSEFQTTARKLYQISWVALPANLEQITSNGPPWHTTGWYLARKWRSGPSKLFNALLGCKYNRFYRTPDKIIRNLVKFRR